MNDKIRKAAEKWIKGAGPESAHPFDMKRFYDLIYECLKYGEKLDSQELSGIIRDILDWNDEYIEEFATDKVILAEKIIRFVEYLKSERQINLYNLL